LPKGREGRPTKRQSAKKKQFADGEKKLKMQNTVINNYHIQRELGRGGMATVYLAHDSKFDTNVAVKLLNKECVHNENIRKRFLAEARNMFRMSHPNIIKVTDLIEEGDTVAFVMEYIEGETLKDYLERKGRLNDKEIKSIFTQMLDAVDYVHEQKLVHRDIKPSNFMITPSGKVKLMDFGIAKNTDSSSAEYTQTGTGVQMGTPMYMSPEQITETKSVTAQSDIYSLGVVLWQMVTGKRPYDTKTLSRFQLESKIVNDPLENTNTIWDRIICKATAKDILLRYTNAFAFKTAVIDINSATETGSSTAHAFAGNEKTVVEEKINQQTQAQGKPVRPISEPANTHTRNTAAPPPAKPNSKTKPLYAVYILVLVVIVGFAVYTKMVEPYEETIKEGQESPLPADLAIDWAEIPGGTYTMGSPSNEADRSDDEMQHAVTLDGFKMSKHEVTFDQYDAFCDATGRSKPSDEGWGRGKRPVINVSWDDAKAFADWVGARLPTEAEWEYACRAGSSTPFSTGDCLSTNEANYDGNYPYQGCSGGTIQEKTRPVGSYAPNAWGMYDMHGNVWEWCADWYGDYPTAAQTNPQGPSSGSSRVRRGGSWFTYARICRSACRRSNAPDRRDDGIGFRLVSPK
jgi:formylglycine-generating enzyme required for sulfatase activity/tRNA A-37 threonylcarbamoyl transferase component Bud32